MNASCREPHRAINCTGGTSQSGVLALRPIVQNELPAAVMHVMCSRYCTRWGRTSTRCRNQGAQWHAAVVFGHEPKHALTESLTGSLTDTVSETGWHGVAHLLTLPRKHVKRQSNLMQLGLGVLHLSWQHGDGAPSLRKGGGPLGTRGDLQDTRLQAHPHSAQGKHARVPTGLYNADRLQVHQYMWGCGKRP
jgi:hypothetical protein